MSATEKPQEGKTMNRFRKRLLMLLLAVGCVGTYWLGAAWRRWATEDLVVSNSDLRLGDVWESADFEKTLTIANRGREDADIIELATSCACARVEPEALVVPAGAQREIRVKVDLTGRSQHEWGKSERELSVRIFPVVGRKSGSTERISLSGWTLRGRVKSRVTLEPPQAKFWVECIRGQKATPITVQAKVHVPFVDLHAPVDARLAKVRVRRKEEHPGQFLLDIFPSDDLPTGEFRFTVPVKVVTPQEEQLDGAVLPVTGEMQDSIRAIPKKVWFGARRLGAVVEETVTLSSVSGSGKFEVRGVDVSGVGLSVKDAAATPEGPRAFMLAQTIVAGGEQRATVKFRVHVAEAKSEILVMVTCHYYGFEERIRNVASAKNGEEGARAK